MDQLKIVDQTKQVKAIDKLGHGFGLKGVDLLKKGVIIVEQLQAI